MISCDFAPNEQWDDALISLKLIFQPWRWKKGRELEEVERKLLRRLPISNPKLQTFLFFSGRSALFFLLNSLRLPKNAEVIVQGFTCEAVILPIIANNLKPVYIDIESSTFSIDPIDLERKINGNTKVIILQHTYGITPMYREKIRSVSKKRGILLIEDIAHGIVNTKIRSLPAGRQVQKSKITYLLSFGRSKAFSSVFGGAVITNNQEIIKRLRKKENSVRTPGYKDIFRLLLYKPLAMLIKSTYDWGLGKIIHAIVRSLNLLVPEITRKEKKGFYNHSFDRAYPNALAILLTHQLNKSGNMLAMRSRSVELYRNNTRELVSPAPGGPLIRFPLLVRHRDCLKTKLQRQNIFLGLWYNQVVGPEGFPLERGVYRKGNCPVAESICQNIINLPTTIYSQEAERIINAINTLNDVKNAD